MVQRNLPAAAAAATGILVGAAIVATRFVIDQTSPAALALLRYLIGFCCLLPLTLMGPWVRFTRRDLVSIALLGMIQFGAVVGLLNYALQFIPSARAALIFATSPLLTLILAAALGHERLTRPKVVGVILTVVGVGFALGEKTVQEGSPTTGWLGEAAVLVSAFSAALCSVLYRPYLRKYPLLPVSAFAMLASILVLAILAVGEGFFTTLPSFTPGGWLAVSFIGLSSGIGYVLWLWALRHTTATNVTVFLALNPITAAGLSALLRTEPISSTFMVGLMCVALGLWLAQRPTQKLPADGDREARSPGSA